MSLCSGAIVRASIGGAAPAGAAAAALGAAAAIALAAGGAAAAACDAGAVAPWPESTSHEPRDEHFGYIPQVLSADSGEKTAQSAAGI